MNDVIEKIAEKGYERYFDDKWSSLTPDCAERALWIETAREILALPEIAVLAENQDLPPNPHILVKTFKQDVDIQEEMIKAFKQGQIFMLTPVNGEVWAKIKVKEVKG